MLRRATCKGLLISHLVSHQGVGRSLPRGERQQQHPTAARGEPRGEGVMGSAGAAGLGPGLGLLLLLGHTGNEHLLPILPALMGNSVPPTSHANAQAQRFGARLLGALLLPGSQRSPSGTSALRRQGMNGNHYHPPDHTQARTLRARLTPLSH